eukprot:6764544-Prymnesium_polylepis.1
MQSRNVVCLRSAVVGSACGWVMARRNARADAGEPVSGAAEARAGSDLRMNVPKKLATWDLLTEENW